MAIEWTDIGRRWTFEQWKNLWMKMCDSVTATTQVAKRVWKPGWGWSAALAQSCMGRQHDWNPCSYDSEIMLNENCFKGCCRQSSLYTPWSSSSDSLNNHQDTDPSWSKLNVQNKSKWDLKLILISVVPVLSPDTVSNIYLPYLLPETCMPFYTH